MIQVLAQPSLRDQPNGKLDELQGVLADRARENHDIRTLADDLVVDEGSGALLLRSLDFKPFRMKPLALSQLSNRLGIPYSYIERCPSTLAAENLNHWLRNAPDRKLMLRCRGDEVRAVLSARYYPIDDVDLIRWVTESFGRDFPLRFEVTDESLDVQLLTEAKHHVDRDDWLNSGLSVHNSEVGLRALEVRGLVYRQVCLNGLILYGKQQGYRRRHIGNTSVSGKVRDALSRLKGQTEQHMHEFDATRRTRMPGFDKVMEEIDRRYDLSEEQVASIFAAYRTEPGDTLYHTINAVTRAGNAETLGLDARRSLQEIGGRMLALAQEGRSWIDKNLN